MFSSIDVGEGGVMWHNVRTYIRNIIYNSLASSCHAYDSVKKTTIHRQQRFVSVAMQILGKYCLEIGRSIFEESQALLTKYLLEKSSMALSIIKQFYDSVPYLFRFCLFVLNIVHKTYSSRIR